MKVRSSEYTPSANLALMSLVNERLAYQSEAGRPGSNVDDISTDKMSGD